MSTLTRTALHQAGIDLQTAIELGDLQQAQVLLSLYGREVELALKSPAANETEITALAEDTKKMFDWTRAKLMTARTEALAALDALHSKRSYLAIGKSGVQSWEIDG